VFDAGVVVVESPECFGYSSPMWSSAEDLGNAPGQSEALELIQYAFEETGAKTR